MECVACSLITDVLVGECILENFKKKILTVFFKQFDPTLFYTFKFFGEHQMPVNPGGDFEEIVQLAVVLR